MQVYVGVLREKRIDALRLVRREIVRDYMDLSVLRLAGDYIAQKRDEFFARVPRRCLADHFAGLRVEGRVQRERSVSVVFESVPFGTAG